ncbi:hypothetical protein E3A20_07030, partial [Planctomyces bekefii]
MQEPFLTTNEHECRGGFEPGPARSLGASGNLGRLAPESDIPYDLTVRDRNKFRREDCHVPASEKKFELSELFIAFED